MEAKDGRRRSYYEQQRRHDDGDDDANLDRLGHMLQLVPISLPLTAAAAAAVSPRLVVAAGRDDARPGVPHDDLAADEHGVGDPLHVAVHVDVEAAVAVPAAAAGAAAAAARHRRRAVRDDDGHGRPRARAALGREAAAAPAWRRDTAAVVGSPDTHPGRMKQPRQMASPTQRDTMSSRRYSSRRALRWFRGQATH